MVKKLGLLLSMGAACVVCSAQQHLGIRNSNYAGISGAYLNPSSIADSKLKWDIQLAAGQISFDNDFLYLPKDSLTFLGFGNIIDQIENDGLFTRYNPGNPNEQFDFSFAAEGMGPSFMFTVAGKHTFGFTSAVREFVIGSDVPGHEAYNAFAEMRDTSLYKIKWSDNSSRLALLGWFEYGLSYATVLYQKGKSEFKGGITGKYLQGAGGAYVNNVNMTYEIFDQDNLYFFNTALDYARPDYNSFEDTHKYKDLIRGNGFGMNIGFIYVLGLDSGTYTYEMDCEKQVDPVKSHYKLRAGLSLIDLGSIKFDKTSAAYHLETDSTNFEHWRGANFSSAENFDKTLSYIFMGDSTASFQGDHFTMTLPTAISLQVDWNIYKNFYANATIVKGFNHYNKHGATQPDIYSLTPRYETRWFEVSVPMSLMSYHHLQPRIGLAVRAGYFFVGSDALGGIFALTDLEGADVYGGVHIFFPEHKLRDYDKDGVSDKKDSCLKEKGTCATHGCPDRDNDGVIDKLDRCPDLAGPAYLHGCPDRDLDSIADVDDSCPDIKGLIQFRGCPDTDSDGIPDPSDSCPTVKGLLRFDGCPDTDMDGIPDKQDSCLLVKGLPQFHGCPDRDGDGVPDDKDKCPDVAGLPQYDGCPETIPQAEITRIELSSQSILFKSGSAVVEPNIYQVLDQISLIMLKYPFVKWKIEGYADNTGSAQINLDLTSRRAEAVKNYLVKKGVSPENLSTYGYGKTHFIATNNTPAGRAKNRRVEVKQDKQ